MWTTTKSIIFISRIKVMLKFSVAADKTPEAPMLEVIALVKLVFFFFTKCSHRRVKRSQYVYTIRTASSFLGLCINSSRHQREFKPPAFYAALISLNV